MLRSDLITRSYNWLMPCAFLEQSIRDFIANLSPFDDAFNQNIFPYYRDDIPTQLLPAMNIYISNVSTKGKYYYQFYEISFDTYLPELATHKRVNDLSHTILTWLDMTFKRPDFQKYVSKCNPGIMDIAGVDYTSRSYNTKHLNTRWDVQVVKYSIKAKFDRVIWAETLVKKYGVSPSNIDMIYTFGTLRQSVPNIILE